MLFVRRLELWVQFNVARNLKIIWKGFLIWVWMLGYWFDVIFSVSLSIVITRNKVVLLCSCFVIVLVVCYSSLKRSYMTRWWLNNEYRFIFQLVFSYLLQLYSYRLLLDILIMAPIRELLLKSMKKREKQTEMSKNDSVKKLMIIER